MKAIQRRRSLICLAMAAASPLWGSPPVDPATVDFGQKLHAWDGFGVHYVEVRHTRDYKVFPQDYGGFKYLSPEQREQVIQLVFGKDGLMPGLVKAWSDPFHELVNDNADPYKMNPAGFDHKTTTEWVRYFCKRGLEETRKRGGDLQFLAGLHAPPGWVTRQNVLQGRDLNPAMKLEVAEYIASWAKYLHDVEGLPVKYISPMNEAENKFKWPADGGDNVKYYGSEHNLWWPDHQVVDFLRYAREVLDRQGLKEVGLSNGETATWGGFFRFEMKDGTVSEFGRRIREDPVALKNLGLITSHGFGRSYDRRGIELLREARPGLHVWTTSCTWGNMSLDVLEDFRQLIYTVQCNGLIPWATVHNNYESDKLSPPGTVRVSSNPTSPIFTTNDGKFELSKAYYYYKQVCRAGQPGMAVAKVSSEDPEVQLLAFASNGTRHPDAFTVLNLAKSPKPVRVRVSGTRARKFIANVTTDPEHGSRNYEPFPTFVYRQGGVEYTAPARSSVTFTATR